MLRHRTLTKTLAVIGFWAAVTWGNDSVRVIPVEAERVRASVEVVRTTSEQDRHALALRDLAEVGPFAGVAARYVADHGVREAVPDLIALALGERTEDSFLRDQAVRSLGRLGDPRAVAPLVAIAADPAGAWLRVSAVEALVAMGEGHRLPRLAVSGDEDLLHQALRSIPPA